MKVSYKNKSTDLIIGKSVNLIYGASNSTYGLNYVNLDFQLVIDIDHLRQQADVFSREIMTLKPRIQFKRFMGDNYESWVGLLHESFIYSYALCVFYGINEKNLLNFSNTGYVFPGHLVLTRLLFEGNYQFHSRDDKFIPFSFFAKVEHSIDAESVLKPIFDVYPNIKDGFTSGKNPSFMSFIHETVLKGLYDASVFLKSNKNYGGQLFDVVPLNSEEFKSVTSDLNNPLCNGFLSLDGKQFHFIDVNYSSRENIRFNESIFLTRAIGLRSSGLTVVENNFYNVVQRDPSYDRLVKDDVYAILGLESVLSPYSMQQIQHYLGIITKYPNKEKDGEEGDKSGTDGGTPTEP